MDQRQNKKKLFALFAHLEGHYMQKSSPEKGIRFHFVNFVVPDH